MAWHTFTTWKNHKKKKCLT